MAITPRSLASPAASALPRVNSASAAATRASTCAWISRSRSRLPDGADAAVFHVYRIGFFVRESGWLQRLNPPVDK